MKLSEELVTTIAKLRDLSGSAGNHVSGDAYMCMQSAIRALTEAVGHTVVEEQQYPPDPKTYEMINTGGGAVKLVVEKS